jgi:hypothetical protein
MLPGMIHAIMCVVAAGIMAHPLSIAMYVGSFRMSCLVVEFAVLLGRMRSGYLRRTVLRDVLTAATDLRLSTAALLAAMLCYG